MHVPIPRTLQVLGAQPVMAVVDAASAAPHHGPNEPLVTTEPLGSVVIVEEVVPLHPIFHHRMLVDRCAQLTLVKVVVVAQKVSLNGGGNAQG